LRGLVSFTLLAHTAEYVLANKVSALGWIVVGAGLISAACLLMGLMTPLFAVVITIGGAALALSGLFQTSIETIVLAVAVSLLGPGAFSLDARMFGRREILLPSTHHIHRNTDA
jgi:hypothetical protein